MYVEGDLPVMTTGGNNGGNSGFGFGNDAWVLIILFALIFGWGNGGWGGNNGSNGGNGSVMDAYVLNSDFATLQRQLDSGFSGVTAGINQVNQGLCNGFYQEAQLINGVNTNISSEFRGVDRAICNLSSQLADCCCKTQTSIADLKYANAINTRDLIENQNANYRALHDEIVANRIEDKNAQIQAQQNEITKLQLAASQLAQNAYLINELKPCPRPAYITCNPYQSYPYYTNGGCGCGASVQ